MYNKGKVIVKCLLKSETYIEHAGVSRYVFLSRKITNIYS